jgi:N-acetylglucosamine kinase-like BadF-type ATPase
VIPAVLGVDGGNSKTDVALVSEDGAVLGFARGSGSNHQNVGIDKTMSVLRDLISAAADEAGVAGGGPVAGHGAFYLAGADFPEEVEMLSTGVAARRWVDSLTVDNDTFALLRAGTESPNRVGVVCGAGINCVAVSADGSSVRFPSLGAISGDWGGGAELGTAALFHAIRAEDGRGEQTALRRAVPEHFGMPSVLAVTSALHFGRLPASALHELAPVLLRVAAAGDQVAGSVVDRLAEEVFLLVVASLRRLDLLQQPTDIVLGGGVLAARQPMLLGGISRRLSRHAPLATVRVVEDPPVVGAALWGLDAIGASPEAAARLRRELLPRIRTWSQPRTVTAT